MSIHCQQNRTEQNNRTELYLSLGHHPVAKEEHVIQIQQLKKEGNVLFNDALNTIYLRLYGVGHMVKDNSDSEKGNPLSPHWLLLPISSKDSYICTIQQTG